VFFEKSVLTFAVTAMKLLVVKYGLSCTHSIRAMSVIFMVQSSNRYNNLLLLKLLKKKHRQVRHFLVELF